MISASTAKATATRSKTLENVLQKLNKHITEEAFVGKENTIFKHPALLSNPVRELVVKKLQTCGYTTKYNPLDTSSRLAISWENV